LLSQFDPLVITIKETNDLNGMKIEDLQGTLQAHEMKVTERRAGTACNIQKRKNPVKNDGRRKREKVNKR